MCSVLFGCKQIMIKDYLVEQCQECRCISMLKDQWDWQKTIKFVLSTVALTCFESMHRFETNGKEK